MCFRSRDEDGGDQPVQDAQEDDPESTERNFDADNMEEIVALNINVDSENIS